MQINDILLAQNVRRWTIVATRSSQSVAEHSFNVAMIARGIAAEMNIDDTNITKFALDHDLDEIMTGDIPSPAKERMNIPSIYLGNSMEKCNDMEKLIVKAADLIDAYLFIKHNAYDRHGSVVYTNTEKRYDEMMEKIETIDSILSEAIHNIMAQLEFGKFDCEQWDEDNERV